MTTNQQLTTDSDTLHAGERELVSSETPTVRQDVEIVNAIQRVLSEDSVLHQYEIEDALCEYHSRFDVAKALRLLHSEGRLVHRGITEKGFAMYSLVAQ